MNRSASLITILICSAVTLGGQATPRVPPCERVYRDIDRLAAAGLIDTLIVGARPVFSEREVSASARRGAAQSRSKSIREIVGRAGDRRRFGAVRAPRRLRVLDAAMAEVVGLDSPYRGIPRDANGVVDGAINPLVGESRRAADGRRCDSVARNHT